MGLNFGGDFFGKRNDIGRQGKQQFISIPSAAFMPTNADADRVDYAPGTLTATFADSANWIAPVSFPHNAQIDSCLVRGDINLQADTWLLIRVNQVTLNVDIVAAQTVNSTDPAIQPFDIVDNINFYYNLYVTSPTLNGILYAGFIAYTI